MTAFAGATYDEELDEKRLSTMLKRVRDLMSDRQWRTLAEITKVVGGSQAGVSARLRDLRKDHFGKFQVERRRRGKGVTGLFEYRVLPPLPKGQQELWARGGGQ